MWMPASRAALMIDIPGTACTLRPLGSKTIVWVACVSASFISLPLLSGPLSFRWHAQLCCAYSRLSYNGGNASRNDRFLTPLPGRDFDKKKAPAPCGSLLPEPTFRNCYFLALQPHPQPEAFSSFLTMQSLPPQSAHFLGLHLPSLVAPHFSHLNMAMLSPPVPCVECFFGLSLEQSSLVVLIIFSPGEDRCIILRIRRNFLCLVA